MNFEIAFLFLATLLFRVTGLDYNIYTFAGTGASGSSGSGKATSAAINTPRAIWQDTQLNYYVVETGGNCVRKIDTATYILSSFAAVCGLAGSFSGDNGPATSAGINFPVAMFIDSTSRMYFAEFSGHKVRSVTSSRVISTFAGTGTAGSAGNGGKATAATFNGAHGVWANTVGTVYTVEFSGHYARVVSTSNIVSLLAGS